LRSELLQLWWREGGGSRQRARSSKNEGRSDIQLSFKAGNQTTIRLTLISAATSRWYQHRFLQGVLSAVGKGSDEIGAIVLANYSVPKLSDEQKATLLRTMRVPKMDVPETTAVWSDLRATREDMYVIANHIRTKFGFWPFAPLKACIEPLAEFKVTRTFGVYDNRAELASDRQRIPFWYADTCEVVLNALKMAVMEGKELGAVFGRGKAIYVCEQGDFGHTATRQGFVMAASPGDGQGRFHMTGVIQAKDKYAVLKNTIAGPLEVSRRKLKESSAVEVIVDGKRAVFLCPTVDAEVIIEANKRLVFNEDRSKIVALRLIVGEFKLSPSLERAESEVPPTCTIKVHKIVLLGSGDLSYDSMMLGKEGMSHYWCPYCQHSKAQWKPERPKKEDLVLWTQTLLASAKEEFEREKEKSRSVRGHLGVKAAALWSIEPMDIVPPVLHLPLGLVKDVMDDLEDFTREASNCGEDEWSIREEIKIDKRMESESKKKKATLTDTINEIKNRRKELTRTPGADPGELAELKELEETLIQHKDLEIRLEKMSTLDLQKNRALLEKYEVGRTFVENMCLHSIEDVMKDFRIFRTAYMGRTFIGPHIIILMKNAEEIMGKICEKIIEFAHPSIREEDIRTQCDSVQKILMVLNTISSLSNRNKHLDEQEYEALRIKIGELSILWRRSGLSTTPKFHIIESHLYDFVRSLWALGPFSEQSIERTHREAKELEKRTNVNDFVRSQDQVETKRMMMVTPFQKRVSTSVAASRKRNFSATVVDRRHEKTERDAVVKKEKMSKPVLDDIL
jgi:hypothetical protein